MKNLIKKTIIHLSPILALVIIFTGCKNITSSKGSLGISTGQVSSANSNNPEGTPTAEPTEPPSPTPTAEPTLSPDAGIGCTGNLAEFCKGGYDADINHREIPTKVIFINPVSGSLSGNTTADANNIINIANSFLIKDGHRLLKFSAPIVEEAPAVNFSNVMNPSYMINNFGSTQYYVLVLVKNMVQQTGGTIGYSPGLRISWLTKQSIVVMDYDYVVSHANGDRVIVHELFHGLGAPHTTDANGGQDNVFNHGLLDYVSLPLIEPETPYPFQIYIEDRPSFQGIVNYGGYNWDTRTLMMYFATSNPLFLNSDSALNSSYSNILNTYYLDFVKRP